MPTSGTVSGLTLVQDINTCIDAIQTANSGATAPANTSGSPGIGQLWLDTSGSYKILKVYDGASWLNIGQIDASNHIWDAPIGGGTATLASATTTDLCSVPQSALTISGVTTITGFSNTCVAGQIKQLTFSGILTLTHNATSLILPSNGDDITTAVGDTAWAVYLGGSDWRVLAYQRANGAALNAASVFTGAVFFDSPITVTLASGTDNWNPSGLSTLNVVRLTCSSVINVTGLTAPATDGKVVVIDNVGTTNNCTFTSQDANSIAANRFAFDRPISVRPGRSLAIKYDITAARWRLWQEVTAQPIMGGFKNLKITNDPTDGTTLNSNLVGTADQITVEDVNGGAARISSFSCSAALTASGAGGLDTGSAAVGTWYSYWAIFNPTTNAQSCLLSVADGIATQPTMPVGYTFKARLGWGRTQAATNAYFLRVLQYGRTARYVVTSGTNTAAYPSMGTSTSSSLTAFSVSTVAPVTASRAAVVVGNATSSEIKLSPNAATATGSGVTNPSPFGIIIPVGGTNVLTADVLLESSNIYIATAAGTAVAAAYGWEDNL